MKMSKGFITGLIVLAVVAAPACRTTKGKNKNTGTGQTSTGGSTLDTSTIPTTTEQPTRPVEPTQEDRRDFVNEDRPQEEAMPTNVDALNEWAQRNGRVRDAFFGYDSPSLDPDAQAALTTSAAFLRSNSGYNLLIEGHCDERGTEQYNLALGDRRANIAKEFLMTLGIDGSRIRTVSYGEERPFEEGHDEASYAQNRRAHLVIVAGR
jgi:peptidoglycan-associated lipoprotein